MILEQTTSEFLPADGEASWLLLLSSASLLSSSTVQPNHTYSGIFKEESSDLRKPEKDKYQH